MSFKTCTVKTGDKYTIYKTTNCEVQLYVFFHPNLRQKIISSYLSVSDYSKYSYTPYLQLCTYLEGFSSIKNLSRLKCGQIKRYLYHHFCHIFSSLLQTQSSNKPRFHMIKLSKYSFT